MQCVGTLLSYKLFFCNLTQHGNVPLHIVLNYMYPRLLNKGLNKDKNNLLLKKVKKSEKMMPCYKLSSLVYCSLPVII